MTTTVSQLHTPLPLPTLKEMAEATRAHVRFWQEGEFLPLPLLHENLERHKLFFGNAQAHTLRTAQVLIAKLQPRPLSDLLTALEDQQDSDLLDIAGEEAQSVISILDAQLAQLAGENDALADLPGIDGLSDKQRLVAEQSRNDARMREITAESARYQADVEQVQQAIAVLESNGLQTRFGGTVPSVQTLSSLAMPGGEAIVATQAIGKAVQDLQTLLGDVMEGMRYSELQRQTELLRKRAREAEESVRQLKQKQSVLMQTLAALETLPGLEQHRAQWHTAVSQLVTALEQCRSEVRSINCQSAAQVHALDTAFNRLLALELQVVEQLRP